MPCMKFLFVRPDVCRRLPSDSTSRWTPLPWAMRFPLLGLARDLHPLANAHAERTIYCNVEFFETRRCTELFFLYYFRYTSRPYADQEALIKDLNRDVAYQKTTDFFIKCKGLHNYFERNGGSLSTAVANAERSMIEKLEGSREYTYSDLGRLMDRLETL